MMLQHGMEYTPPVDPVTGEDMAWKHTPAWLRSAAIQADLNRRRN